MSSFFLLFFIILIALGMAAEAFGLVLALIVHELAHVLAARLQGCQVEKLVLYPLGGYIQLRDVIEVMPDTERRIALAGPAANLAIALAIMALVPRGGGPYWLGYLLRANLMVMAFNLFPALPLDGGRVLRARLAQWLPYYRATGIVIVCGWLCGVALLVLAVLPLSRGEANPTVFAASLFLLYNAYVERKQVVIPLVRYIVSRRRKLQGAKLMAADTLVAGPGARAADIFRHIRPQRYYQVSVLDETHAVRGLLSEHQILDHILAGSGNRSLLEILSEEAKV